MSTTYTAWSTNGLMEALREMREGDEAAEVEAILAELNRRSIDPDADAELIAMVNDHAKTTPEGKPIKDTRFCELCNHILLSTPERARPMKHAIACRFLGSLLAAMVAGITAALLIGMLILHLSGGTMVAAAQSGIIAIVFAGVMLCIAAFNTQRLAALEDVLVVAIGGIVFRWRCRLEQDTQNAANTKRRRKGWKGGRKDG